MPKRRSYIRFARDLRLSFRERTWIMGIVNITPDSFSGDGFLKNKDDHTQRTCRYARRLIREGADILDIGGESTRPGAPRVAAREERRRIIPVIRRLAVSTDVPLSVDTNKAGVARAALDAGAHMINNIKGTLLNPALLKTIARYDAGVVIMHIGGGTPRTMQKRTVYQHDIVNEVLKGLQNSIEKCLEYGIKSDRIIVDPGIGFGKSFKHNLRLINTLHKFSSLRQPVLLGTSRKSFIGLALDREVSNREWGTAATLTAGIMNGCHIVRVHNVKHLADTVRMTDTIINEKKTASCSKA
ncbi:MAG: dihydropteroate synthase [Candidatus Omnitrophota bacterium]